MDNGKVTALTLLDLSAAFDTIDHSTLLERLHGHFGISDAVFRWFKSYISNRQQRVHIDGSLSCTQDLHFGIPQGSVLGPFLFCLYTMSISQIITTHDVSHHMYADDTQVCIELSPDMPQFRGGNPYFLSENLYQSVSFTNASQGSTLAVFRYPEHPRFSDGIPDSPAQ